MQDCISFCVSMEGLTPQSIEKQRPYNKQVAETKVTDDDTVTADIFLDSFKRLVGGTMKSTTFLF